VNWIIDTQLPHQLATALKQHGQNAVHASELPGAHRTTDAAIMDHAMRTNAVVVTKDADFLAAYQLKRSPARLLYVSTGNIGNRALIFHFMRYLDVIIKELERGGFVELTREEMLVR
jgi:predicted nuclease of predicted toxin-antitoxin system